MREGSARAQPIEHVSVGPRDMPRPATEQGRARPRRVALVGPSGASMAVALGALLQDIVAHGHQVVCFAPELDPQASQSFARMGVKAFQLPAFRQGLSPLADLRSMHRLAGALKQMRPDIVAGYSPKGAALAAVAGRRARVGHVVTLLSELGRGFAEAPERASFTARTYQKALLRLAFRFSNTAVFFNEENHKILERYKLLPTKLRQFPLTGPGVDLHQFPNTPLPSLDRGVMFLFAGPLDRRFGAHDYCEAARLLRAKSGNFRCLIAGPEVRGANAFPLTELKRYRDVVHYLGPQADPRSYMAGTHAFVLPAIGDVVPAPLIEAMAMGRPVITTTARGCRGAVSGGTNGMLVPPGDPAALASAMARLLLRPDLIPSMARASRAFAESRFDSRRINAQLIDALGL